MDLAWFNPATWTVVDKLQGQNNQQQQPPRNTDPYMFGGEGMPTIENKYQPQAEAQFIDNSGNYISNQQYTQQKAASGGGSRAAAAPAYNPDDLNYLNDQENRLRAMFGEADTALNQGRQGIADEFGRTEQRKREDQARVNRDYDNKEADTTTKKQSALGKVNDNARTLANSVRRKLALASGTSSSAYQDEAPQAVAKEATEGRTNVLEDFAGNFNALKRAREDTKSEFERMFEDLRIQRQGRERQLEEGVMANRQDIDTKLSNLASERAKLLGGGYKDVRIAQQPYEAAINARKAEISSLFDKYRTPFTPQAVNVANPSLRDYLVERKGITPEQQQVETYNDYLTKLKKQDEEGAF
jgi:hypothetical protein